MAETVWGIAAESGKKNEGFGAGEHPAEEAGSRLESGQCDFTGGELGKLLSPAKRRAAVKHVCGELGVAERRACRVLKQGRSAQRRRPEPREDESRLQARILLRTLRLPTHHGLALPGGLEGESQAHRASVATAGIESSSEAAEAPSIVAKRCLVNSSATDVQRSCLEL